MEDLKLRLKFDDTNIRSRCLQKLLNSVRKKAKGSSINSSSVQIPELNIILEACEADSAVTCNLAVQTIISLVVNNCMKPDYAITKLIGCMKSSNNYECIIKGIITLLMHECSETGESQKILKYSLLFPKHPLITALEDKNDSFPFIIDCIVEALATDFEKGFQAVEPVICYILCNPGHKLEFNYLNVLLLEALTPKDSEAVIQVLKYVPFMQIESLHKVVEVSVFMKKLFQNTINVESSDENWIHLTKSVFLILFSLTERSIAFGHNSLQLCELMIEFCQFLQKLDEKSSTYINICLILVSYMMKSASGLLLEKLTVIGLELLDSDEVSPTVAAILSLSVLHVLPEPSMMLSTDNLKVSLSKLLGKLELLFLKKLSDDVNEIASENDCMEVYDFNKSYEYETFSFLEAFTMLTGKATACVRFSKVLDNSNLNFKLNWLKHVKLYVDSSNNETFEMTYSLVTALLLMSSDSEIFIKSCLETVESILTKNSYFSTRIFSVLLYKLSLVECPKSKILILNFLPKSAVHKYSIPPVLGILQMMANETELRAHAIYLMLQLWKKQNRCFPYLHNLLAESTKTFTFDSGVDEILIAQAAAIHEICCSEPEKYGHEFLKTLSSIFNKSNDEASLPVACLAIDGMIALCKSEIIDIRSTWKALSSRFSRDKRILVVCRLYKLLSLIPDLKVKSFEYDKFMSDTVANIWKQISASTNSPAIIKEAFRTLAKFPMDCHVLKQLPAAAKENLKLPASMKATPFEMSKLPEDVLNYIPGYCFIDLLTSFEDRIILEGYAKFLRSLVKMEVEELPRSAYSQQRHISKRKKVSEALSKVPEFLCTQIQARKSPALQKNLAVGVLFCYEPPVEIGKDGMPIKRSVASQSRSYEQVLSVLLCEVNIDTTEWHRCILISTAWGAFMERAFFSCEEARKAELDLQYAHGHLNLTSEELSLQSKSAWLWVRDRFVNLIKTNVKNTPTAHANAVFAISGLILALEKFFNSLDEESKVLCDENEKYTRHMSFTAEYTETVICAMHPDYQPTGNVQSWLLTHLSRPNSSASCLVTGCASSSLCHLTPILLSHYPEEIPRILRILLKNLSHTSPVLSFYSGLGLALFIKSLCEVGFPDNGEYQANLLLNILKETVNIFDDSEGSLSNCLIALCISVTSLSQIVDENIKDWISTTCNIFYEKLMDEEKSSMQFEMLCICVTAMIISAVEGSCLPIHSVEDLASWLDMNRLELPQCSGISVSLGMVIEAYERFGHSESGEMKQKMLKAWFNAITSERKPTLHRIAALNGLCSLFSCGRGLLQVKAQPASESTSPLNDLIPFMFQILGATRDTGLQNICSWEVGRLFAVNSNQQQAESSVSSSYSYLGEKSILKPLMNIIISYQKDDENVPKYCHVVTCLKSLATPFPRPLPPINWVSILTPFLQQNEDNESVEAALKICIYQSNGSSYAANLVSSYSNPPLIHTLSEYCFKILLENISGLVLVLSPPKLHVFLQTIISLTIKKDDSLHTLGDITLKGILNSLKLTGCKEQTKKVIYDAFIYIFKYFKTKEDHMNKFLPWISEAILELHEETFDSVLAFQNTDEVSLLTMIWCYLIKTGKKPLSCLRLCVEEGKCSSFEQKEKIRSYIYNCFLDGSHNEKSDISQASKCISWLLETIGWIKVLEDSKSKYQLLTAGDVYLFLIDVCFATVVGCSGLENSYCCPTQQNLSHKFLLESLSQAICSLSQKDEWNAITEKIIDWLLMMLKSQYLNDKEKYYIKLCLCSLRNTSQFKKNEIWTEILCNIIFSQ